MKKGEYKNISFLNDNSNEFLFTFQNYNKYIKKLLELSPMYFEEFINKFNNEFDFIKVNKFIYANKMDESFLNKKNELIKLSKKIENFLLEKNVKEADNKLYLSTQTFLDDNIKNIYEDLVKIHKDFDDQLSVTIKKMESETQTNNNKNIINFDSFTTYNTKIISQNYKILENIKITFKHKKYKNSILIFICSIVLMILAVVFLLLFLYKF